jgi:hypothetical protein
MIDQRQMYHHTYPYKIPAKAAKAPTMMEGHAAPTSSSGFLSDRKPMITFVLLIPRGTGWGEKREGWMKQKRESTE